MVRAETADAAEGKHGEKSEVGGLAPEHGLEP
jgi:hypothetical protein